MKNYEKKSFFTTFILFFIPLFFLSSVVLYMYHNEQKQDMQNNILYKMKEYTFDFKSDNFFIDVVPVSKEKELFKLYHQNDEVFAYFQIPTKNHYLLKVLYDNLKYQMQNSKQLQKIISITVITYLLIFFISIAFAFYSLKPMREAINLLEDFLKDLIHDLNTPATSILLNSRLLRKRGDFEEIERIEISAKGIASLYKNLELMTPSNITNNENICIDELVLEKIKVLRKIYPDITFTIEFTGVYILSNKNAIERILDNLLTNACKYNTKNGKVSLFYENNKLTIIDTGIGIHDTKKVFQRYYKENENGLGIGMSIVKQLCDILNIKINIFSELTKGTKIELEF